MNILEIGLQKGIEQGIEQGIQQGIQQDKLNVAKNLLSVLPDEVIAEKVGLDIGVVKEIRCQNTL